MDDTNENISETLPKKVSNKLPRPIWRVDFGKFQYFPEIRTLKVGKETRRLSATPAALLDLLIRKQGQVILRKEIVEFAWPGTKEVLDASFYQVIKRLRDSLDDPVEPRTVITNPFKNAYALQPRATIRYKRTKQEIRRTRWTIASLLTVLMGSLIVYALTPPPPKVAGYRASDYYSITTLNGQIKRASMSPDKSIIVFSYKAPNSTGLSLMAKRMSVEEYSTLVPYSESVHNNEPSFSPSGRQLAWVANNFKRIAKCSIMIADFNPENMSISNQKVVLDCSVSHYGRTPQWKSESILLVSLPPKPNQPSGVVKLDLSTKEHFVITSPSDVGYGDYSLFYNQATNKVAYLRQSLSTGTGTDLRVYDFVTEMDRSIKKYASPLYTVAWVNDQKLLTKGRDGFEVVSLNSKTFPIDSDSIEPEHFPFSMGENQVGFVKGNIYALDINLIDLINDAPSRPISSNFHDYRPVIAKVSGDVAFVSMRNGKRQVFVTNNNIFEQITHFIDRTFILDIAISSDGGLVAIAEVNRLTILNRSGEVLHQLSLSVKGISFTSDNESLLFGIENKDAKFIKQLNLADFSESIVTDGFMPKADEKGNIFFFRSLKNTKVPVLYQMSRNGGVFELFEAPFHLVNSNSFDIINNKLYYVTQNKKADKSKKKELILVSEDLTTREIETITPITATKFSLNKDITKVVTTQQGVVQNNLASFRLVKEDLIEAE